MDPDPSSKMAYIREDFDKRSAFYDSDIVKIFEGYDDMLDAAVESMPFRPDQAIDVVDLGTGTGSLAWRIKQGFPNARLLCVDMTESMLNVAKERFKGVPGVRFLQKDFYHLQIPRGQDAVVASLALHHLVNDEDKKRFYTQVRASLKDGGVFINADAVMSADPWMDDLYKRKWKDFMGLNLTDAEIQETFDRHRREDALPYLLDQLRWLHEAGFRKVDVVWKKHMSAVVWARR